MRCLLFIILVFTLATSGVANPIAFTENIGQWKPDIRYKANIPGGFLLVKSNSIEYVFYDTKTLALLHGQQNSPKPQIAVSHVTVKFKGCNTKTFTLASGEISERKNYFLGNLKKHWISGVKSFNEIIIKNLYTGIDLRLYTIAGKLKYEYIVTPGANPASIAFEYYGTKNIRLTDDALLVETDVNVFKEFNPFTYQENQGKTVAIDAHFIRKNNTIAFKIGAYNPSKSLIIDPELVFSTYSGSFSDNWAHTATYDTDGNLYAGGSVFGESFLITELAFQQAIGGAASGSGARLTTDIVIQKYSSDGSQLLYSTFLGGVGSEVPHSLIVNNQGELVIFGTTSSINFPITERAFDSTFNGGISISGNPITSNITYADGADIFVTVVSPLGDTILGSTFIGGSENDGINDTRTLGIRNYGDEFRGEVVVDEQDRIYVATVTKSRDFPTTDNSTPNTSGNAVAFRLSSRCQNLEWCTALGGSGYDAAFSLKVSSNNEVFVCGVTTTDGLAKKGVFSTTLSGLTDGFVAKFVADTLQAFTYVGTPETDITLLLDLDQRNNVYVLGLTTGTYPVTPGVYRNENSGQFIQVVNENLQKSIFSTVFGSSRGPGIIDIVPTAFLVNDCGNMYVAGWGGKVNVNSNLNENSSTSGLPTTRDAYKRTTSGSNYYFTILEANARSLLYGSYFGSEPPLNTDNERGDHLDGGTCRFDKRGVIYHAACVCKADDFVSFPIKNATSATHNSTNCNLAAFKFDIDALSANFTYRDETGSTQTEYCGQVKLTFDNLSDNARTYEWFVNDTLVSRQNEPNYTFTKTGSYVIKLVAYNTTRCISADSMIRTINLIEFNPKATADTSICPTAELLLEAAGGDAYRWSSNVGIENVNKAEIIVKPRITDSYTVEISKGICQITLPVLISVSDEKADFSLTPSREICVGDSVLLSISGDFSSFIWRYDGNLDSTNRQIKVSPNSTTTYQVDVSYEDGCKPTKSSTLRVDKSYAPAFRTSYTPICGSKSVLSFLNDTQNAASFLWDFGNGQTSQERSPTGAFFQEDGVYRVSLQAKNLAGCSLVITKDLNYYPWDGVVPNVITPNGDGKNDVLFVGTEAGLTIYNRWGKLIYANAAYDNTWGENVTAGTYFYELILPNGSICKGYLDVLN